MAIYSFKMENISRDEGQSSVNSAAYRHRKIFFDNRTGEVCGRKTAHKKDLALTQIFAPEHTVSISCRRFFRMVSDHPMITE